MPLVYTYEQLVEIGNRYFPISPSLKEIAERCDIRRAVLERIANAYRIVTPQDQQEQRLKAMKGLLNKITPEKYEELAPQITQQFDSENSDQLLALLFEKAFLEQKLNELYAQLCADLKAAVEKHGKDEEAKFCRALAIRCSQDSSKLFADSAVTQDEVAAERQKKRIVGCAKFVGELYRFGLVSESFVVQHLQRLLHHGELAVPSAAELQGSLCLLEACGAVLDPNPNSTTSHSPIASIVSRITELSESYPQPRMRFLLMDLLDLRKRDWVPRHPKPKLLKLSEGTNLKQVPVPTSNPELQPRVTIPQTQSLASRFARPEPRLPAVKRKEPDGGAVDRPPSKKPVKMMTFEEKCAIWAKIERRKEEAQQRAEAMEKAQKEAYKQSKPHLRDGAVWERGVLAPDSKLGSQSREEPKLLAPAVMAAEGIYDWLHDVGEEELQHEYELSERLEQSESELPLRAPLKPLPMSVLRDEYTRNAMAGRHDEYGEQFANPRNISTGFSLSPLGGKGYSHPHDANPMGHMPYPDRRHSGLPPDYMHGHSGGFIGGSPHTYPAQHHVAPEEYGFGPPPPTYGGKGYNTFEDEPPLDYHGKGHSLRGSYDYPPAQAYGHSQGYHPPFHDHSLPRPEWHPGGHQASHLTPLFPPAHVDNRWEGKGSPRASHGRPLQPLPIDWNHGTTHSRNDERYGWR